MVWWLEAQTAMEEMPGSNPRHCKTFLHIQTSHFGLYENLGSKVRIQGPAKYFFRPLKWPFAIFVSLTTMSKMPIYAKIGVFCNLFTKNGFSTQCETLRLVEPV